MIGRCFHNNRASRSGLVLAAHGSDAEPEVNERLRCWARLIGERRCFDEVVTAFHQGDPPFARVLDRMIADRITVVPVMTSEGYYSDVVLPRALTENARYRSVTLHQTRPIGCHPGMGALIERRAMELCSATNMALKNTCLLIVGHGTARHARSRATTESIINELARRDAWGRVSGAFLDDDPKLETVFARLTLPQLLVIPFMIGGGPHATRDTPRRLGLDVSAGTAAPFTGSVGSCRVTCDAAIGNDPRVVDMIVDLACRTETNHD